MNYLFFSNDAKLGDAVLSTYLIEAIGQNDPQATIDIVTSGPTTAFWRNDPRVHKTIVLHKAGLYDYIKVALEYQRIDYLIFLRRPTSERLRLFRLFTRARNTIVSSLLPNQHAIKRCVSALETIFRKSFPGNPRPVIRRSIEFTVAQDLIGMPFVLLNIFGGDVRKTMSKEKAKDLLSFLELNTGSRYILPAQSFQSNIVDEIISVAHDKTRFLPFISDGDTGVEELIVLCKNAQAIVTVDTATTHIASAFNIPTTVIIFPDDQLIANWAPLSENSFCVRTAQSSDISDFSNDAVLACLHGMLSKH